MFPPAMLEKLYVKGSLKNTETGFELLLRNNIDSGTAIGFGPLVVDGASYPAEALTLQTRWGQWRADQISFRSPVPVGLGTEIKVSVAGQPLAPGAHHLGFTVLVSEIGRIQFEAADQL